MTDPQRTPESIAQQMYQVDSSDPRSVLIDRSHMSEAEVRQIGRLMHAMSDLRKAEDALSAASQKYMGLSAQDMRALHYLIVAKNRDQLVTPSMIATHLGISAASTSKLLNKLEEGGHIVRAVHPEDRRAFSIQITPETEVSAMETVGNTQARRFHAAARLTEEEREVVIRFLNDTREELSLSNATWAQEPQ